MKVLIVKKVTNFELYAETIQGVQRVTDALRLSLLKLKEEHDEHYHTLDRLKALLQKLCIAYSEHMRGDELPVYEGVDVVITVGGDGTVLSAGHEMPDGGILLGIRSSPSSVGQLCCGESKTLEHRLSELADGRLSTISVERLAATIQRASTGQKEFAKPVLNDYLFANKSPAATTRYVLTLDDESEQHKSSGIWISTAVGSSAAISASGGTSLAITDRRFQFLVRELFQAPGTKARLSRGIFNPDIDRLSVESRSERALLAVDGQHGEIAIHYGDVVYFSRAEPIQLVKPDHLKGQAQRRPVPVI